MTIDAYAEHIEVEVLGALMPTDADAVLFRAATAARAAAHLSLEGMADPSPWVEAERLDNWCRSAVRPMLSKTISEHEARHTEFIAAIRNAAKGHLTKYEAQSSV